MGIQLTHALLLPTLIHQSCSPMPVSHFEIACMLFEPLKILIRLMTPDETEKFTLIT